MKPHEDGRVKSFPNIFKRFCFFDSGPDCPPTESVRDGTMTLAYPPSHVRKSEGLAKAQRTPRTPLVFLAFPAPWRDTIFPALNDPHLLSESELIVWKARTHFLQEIFCSAPIGWLGAVTPRRSLPTRPDREGRAVRLAGPTPRRKPHPERRSGLSLV